MDVKHDFDVLIIGAGPSGAVAASMLVMQGKSVLIIEKQHFNVIPAKADDRMEIFN